MVKLKTKNNLSIIVACIWTIFTMALVSWWLFYLVNSTEASIASHHKMLVWEGGFLLISVVLGGTSLLIFILRDRQNLIKLKTFFSIFSHDLKTSMARLRIQAEVLQENQTSNPMINSLVQNIDRLNLQLENALWIARGDEINVLLENHQLSNLIGDLKSEFPEVKVRIDKNVEIRVDKRLMTSVLRNLLHNSIHHGRATEIRISCSAPRSGRIKIDIQDNGLGASDFSPDTGNAMLNPKEDKTNGLGLFLSKQVIKKQHGEISFTSKENQGFSVSLSLEGKLL